MVSRETALIDRFVATMQQIIATDPFAAKIGQAVGDHLYQVVVGCGRHWVQMHGWHSNLTHTGDMAEAIWLHYLDSLSLLLVESTTTPQCLVDFGSGAGFPGLVLAIARPQWRVTLVEARRKRCSFLQHGLAVLEDTQTCVRWCRFESAQPGNFSLGTTRATCSQVEAMLPMLAWLLPNAALYAWRQSEPASVMNGVCDQLLSYDVLGRRHGLLRLRSSASVQLP